jgi:hypothetical protein
MAILLDKLVPPIIVGLLIIMIFRLNAFMMESQVDNRLSNEMQTFSELASAIIQEELRSANHIVTLTENSITYDDINGIRVIMERVDHQLVITKIDPITQDEIVTEHATYLSSLEFTPHPIGAPLEQIRFLQVRLSAESNPETHMKFNSDIQTAKAFSERRVYLRNVAAATFQL